MKRQRVSLALAVAVIGCGMTAADASGAIPSGVTIHYTQSKGLYGFVFSPHPKRCTTKRWVRVFKQRGPKQDRRRDSHVARVLPDKAADGRYRWHLRHFRVTKGDYYARMAKSRGCERDASKTIHVKHPQPRSAS